MNLKHLRYFWTVARLGGVARAAERLNLAPQTVSAQVKLLEEDLGASLFRPAGRGLELTEAGRMALSYADEMLALGDEMKSALAARQTRLMPILRVGITDVVPKSVAYRLLAPLGALEEPMRLLCREGQLDLLLGELALHRLDMVLADRPMPAGLAVRGHSHKLGESSIGFFAAPALIDADASFSSDITPAGGHESSLKLRFPRCLDDAPLLLPGAGAAVRGPLERWLDEARIKPRLMGEFDDGALMKAFGQAGAGFFPAPALLHDEIAARYAVRMVGEVDSIREAFWLISGERRITHPAIQQVVETARDILFAGGAAKS